MFQWLRIHCPALIGFILFWCLLALWTGATTATAAPLVQTGNDDPPPLGEPCGNGELLPEWVVCLHGTISLVDAAGQVTPQDGIPITITRGSLTVTDTASIHPGQKTPTYGIDLSLLEPDFLQPVTLTALVNGRRVERQVVVFPDFGTHNQQFDLQIPLGGDVELPPVWGHVTDFASQSAVSSATVVVEYNGQQRTVTTAPVSTLGPIFALDAATLADLGATPGSEIVLTATYNGDVDQRTITVDSTPTQIEFITGWKCDDSDPLPQSGGKFGLPQSGGKFGLPDMGCIWGYGRVDGVPTAGVEIILTIDEDEFRTKTGYYPGETLSRYGIGVWGVEALAGKQMTITAVYNGFTNSQVITGSLDAAQSQQVDVDVIDIGALGGFSKGNFTNANDVRALLWHDGYLWAGSLGGVVRWNPTDNSYTKFTTSNGLADNSVSAIIADQNGSLWFGTRSGISQYTPSTNMWQTYTTADGLIDNGVFAIVTDQDGNLWFGTVAGVSQYTPNTNMWQTYTTSNGLIDNSVNAIAKGRDGDLWFGTSNGVNRYTPSSGVWQSYTTAHGLAGNTILSISVDKDGNLWFSTYGYGVSRYSPSTEVWQTYTIADGLIGNSIKSITVDRDANLWFGDWLNPSASRYTPNTGIWQTYQITIGQASHVNAITADEEGHVWFGTETGINRYFLNTGSWQTYTTADGPLDSPIGAIAVDGNGNVWTSSNTGINRYDPSTGVWQNYTASEGLVGSTIAVDKNGNLWFGSVGKGATRYTPSTGEKHTYTTSDGLVSNTVVDIAVSGDGSIWFGTDNGASSYIPSTNRWESYTTVNGLAANFVQAIAVSGNGDIWFGIYGSTSVSRYVPSTGDWQTYTITDGLTANPLIDIAVDRSGNLWVGTAGSGVSRYTPKTGAWRTFTRNTDGLAHNEVYAITVAENGNIWFGTEGSGVSRYTPSIDLWQTFTDDGVGDASAIVVDRDDNVWLGARHGLRLLQPPPQQSDLSLQLTGPASSLPGNVVTYMLPTVNFGEADAATVLTLTLPAGAAYQNANLAPVTLNPLTWNLGTLVAGGAPITVVVTTTLDANLSPGLFLEANATVGTTALEAFLSNNSAKLSTFIRDPDRADVRATLLGPPVLIANQPATYTLWVDNNGGLAAVNTRLTVTLDPNLSFQRADPPPTTPNALTWDWANLPILDSPRKINLFTKVANTTPVNTDLTVTANIATDTPESDTQNNLATATIATSLADARTLILVAPERLAQRYGASGILGELYRLAEHPQVQGALLDLLTDPSVQAAYQAWGANPGDWRLANQVATRIKALIDQYTKTYPNLHYLLLVGGDDVIPFYRVADQNDTIWHERGYLSSLPTGSVYAALKEDKLLTDDFYADRTATLFKSPYWRDGHPLFIPDFSVGRLVETPDEMSAAIKTFLATNGVFTLNSALVGGDAKLTADLNSAQCQMLQRAGLAAVCTNGRSAIRNEALRQPFSSFWMAPHSNHFSQGELRTYELLDLPALFNQSLLISIGCHVGLSVPANAGSRPDQDWAQTILGRGGAVLGSTAYAYASDLSVGYSESLMRDLTNQLVMGVTPTLGDALVRAKQRYFAARQDKFDYLDEKVLLPVTLYGLPMLRVALPNGVVATAAPSPFAQPADLMAAAVGQEPWRVVTYTLNALTYNRNVLAAGVYYDYQGQISVQDGLPVQPAWQELLAPLPTGETPRGVLLRRAGYHDEPGFTPLIAQAWAIGEPRATTADRVAQSTPPQPGWDRERPYELGQFVGLSTTVSTLNLVLGAYNAADQQRERLYDNLTLAVLYSSSADQVAPAIASVTGYTTNEGIQLRVNASDESQLALVQAVCDNGAGQWTPVLLLANGTGWSGRCPVGTVRFYGEVADGAGNTTVSAWATPTPQPVQEEVIYLGAGRHGRIKQLLFADEDILAYRPATGAWSLAFDGSTVGLTFTDVKGFYPLADGQLLLTFGHPTFLPGLGWVDDSDIVRFTPGQPRRSAFTWFLDGSDVGLTQLSEGIDAMSLAPDGRLLISTIGTVNAPGVVAQDEDVIVFTGTLGENASGVWSLYFDGSAVGLTTGSEDVTGIWVDGATQDLYLTTKGPYSVSAANTLTGDNNDIFVCHPPTPGNAATCVFSRFFDGNAVGLSGPVDGIFIQPNALGVTAAAFAGMTEADETQFEAQSETPTAEDALDAELDAYDQDPEENPAEVGAVQIFLPLIAR